MIYCKQNGIRKVSIKNLTFDFFEVIQLPKILSGHLQKLQHLFLYRILVFFANLLVDIIKKKFNSIQIYLFSTV